MATPSHAAGLPRPGRWRPVVIDVGLTALTFAATVAMLHSGRFEDDPRDVDAWGIALAALTALPLLARRRWPLVVFPLVWIPTVILYGMGYSLGPPIGSMIALYTVAASTRHSPGAARGTSATGCGCGASGSRPRASGRPAASGSRLPRSAPASPATCTTRPATRST